MKISPKDGIKILLGLTVISVLAGCYVEGGGVVGGPVFLGGPYYEHSHVVHVYSHRGYESRHSVHGDFHGHRR